MGFPAVFVIMSIRFNKISEFDRQLDGQKYHNSLIIIMFCLCSFVIGYKLEPKVCICALVVSKGRNSQPDSSVANGGLSCNGGGTSSGEFRAVQSLRPFNPR